MKKLFILAFLPLLTTVGGAQVAGGTSQIDQGEKEAFFRHEYAIIVYEVCLSNFFFVDTISDQRLACITCSKYNGEFYSDGSVGEMELLIKREIARNVELGKRSFKIANKCCLDVLETKKYRELREEFVSENIQIAVDRKSKN